MTRTAGRTENVKGSIQLPTPERTVHGRTLKIGWLVTDPQLNETHYNGGQPDIVNGVDLIADFRTVNRGKSKVGELTTAHDEHPPPPLSGVLCLDMAPTIF